VSYVLSYKDVFRNAIVASYTNKNGSYWKKVTTIDKFRRWISIRYRIINY